MNRSIAAAIALGVGLAACKKSESVGSVELRQHVLTQEDQRALTPDLVVQRLKEGNARFVRNDLTARDHSAMVRKAAKGQFPKAVVLSCLDSRVPVEDVFDCGIGDLFVGRVAGNFADVDQIGSMEFGAKISGAKVVVVLGHEDCGAIKGAIDGVELGNVTAMLANLKPAVASSHYEGDASSKNPAFVELVAKTNVAKTIDDIRARSPILKAMADSGEIRIVGAYYNLTTGVVTFL